MPGACADTCCERPAIITKSTPHEEGTNPLRMAEAPRMRAWR